MDCSPLINKISEQFQCWQKKKALSYAGRLQLIKSVILGIHLFWTSNYILPVKVLEKIDSLCSDFLWNGKIHLVSWSDICQSKKHGGLGIYAAKFWNQAAALKLLWLIHLKKDMLWIKWVHENYLKQTSIWLVQAKVNDSWMWKQIIKIRDKMIGKFDSVTNLQNIIAVNCSNSKERLCRMRVLDTNTCTLCSHQQPETCKHLFFECDYSVYIWNRVMDWLNYKWRSCSWDNVVDWYTLRLKGEGFMKKLKRMALYVSVYAIWQERNRRIFQSIARGPEPVFRSVKITILSKILNDDIPVYIKEKIEHK
ncbi:uncharacterized protein LOC109847522 [Asparagus officinalis]|uniref:uncharacterized protein LOC109847522 n=1 Tax=Asparagus officinalis TaxID=4686 RepID=UPI00098E3ED2|nr:uncharacterized protein LOC109847522 [Asparagus officinalis]